MNVPLYMQVKVIAHHKHTHQRKKSDKINVSIFWGETSSHRILIHCCYGVNYSLNDIQDALTSVVNKQEHRVWIAAKGGMAQRESNKHLTESQQDHKNDKVHSKMAVMSDLKIETQNVPLYSFHIVWKTIIFIRQLNYLTIKNCEKI